MLRSLLPKEVKVNFTIDSVGLKSNLTTNKTKGFTKKSFFLYNTGFIESRSGALGDIDGFVQLIPGTYKGNEPINITAIARFILNVIVYKDR